MPGLKDRVKEAARGRWVDLLVEVGGLPADALDGSHHPCPRCGGKDRFRLIDKEAGAVLCNQCFKDKNGDGLAALQWAKGWTLRETIDNLADRLGVPKKSGSKEPDAYLQFEDWSEGNLEVARIWTLRKRGITVEALRENGGRIARWRGLYKVVALPVIAPGQEKAAGWVIWNSTGQPLKKYDGTEAKVLVTFGSKAGWLGAWAIGKLATADVVWKVEGPSDMLALWSAIPAELRDRHLVLSNAFGSGEKPRPHLIECLRGKKVNVLHDNDAAGEKGAGRWADIMAVVAGEIRNVKLPAAPAAPAAPATSQVPAATPMPAVPAAPPPTNGAATTSGGVGVVGGGSWKDLRDWLNLGHTYDELRRIAESTPPVEKSGLTMSALAELGEEDDDPARLAREFLHAQAGRLAYWREDFYRWDAGRWVRQPNDDIRSDVIVWIRNEFERLYLDAAKEKGGGGGGPGGSSGPGGHGQGRDDDRGARVIRTTDRVISSVMAILRGFACVSSAIEWGSELDPMNGSFSRLRGGRSRKWIAVENGILKVEDRIEGRGGEIAPHSPLWWSPHRMGYRYDPNAGFATCARFAAFLKKNLEDDLDRIALLQEWAGYCLTPSTDLQKFLLLEGEGANGKSVYCAILEALLGYENVSHVPLELFGQRFALTPTLGKLANLITEVGELDRVAEGLLKAYTDGSGITFDRKNKEQVEARPTARLVISVNNRPRFSDRSGGLWRRMLICPFNVQIRENERVIGMDKPDFWIRSGEMPAILNWAVAGLARLEMRGRFTEPAASRAAIEDYKIEVNPAREFLLDNYEEVEGYDVTSDDIYKGYQEFCIKNGYRGILGSRQFGKEIRRVFRSAYRIRLGQETMRQWGYKNVKKKAYIV